MHKIRETTAYKKALKGRILEAAMKAFAERGVKAVRMDDISQSLSISKRTLYEIYSDKEELLFQGVMLFDQKQKKSMSAFTGSVNPLFYEDIQKYPKVVEYLNNERERTYKFFIELLKRGADEGYFRNDIDFELVSQMFNAINSFVMTQHMLSRYSIQQVFSSMLLVPLRGICTEKGLKVIENNFKTQ